MKKVLHLMAALLLLVGVANAQQQTYDFEDGTIPAGWTNDATYPWTVINILSTTGGSHCIQSGNAGVHNSSSTISFAMSYTQPGYIMFDANCMGEGTSWDVCVFAIDGIQQFSIGENVMGWHTYGYNVSAGNHIFTWTYSKDGSDNPTGDGFQVDNVVFGFGSACIAPTEISMNELNHISWNGMADSYTLRYKKGSGAWQSITGITENSYDVTSLNLKGNYTFEVKADCDPSHPVSSQFYFVESWENWYIYDNYNEEFDHFRIGQVTTATTVSSTYSGIVCTAFFNGEVWCVVYNNANYCYDLMKAPIDIWNHQVGTPVMVVENISNTYVQGMAYNPVDGRLYFIVNGHLLSRNPAAPTVVTDFGELMYGGSAYYGFAINSQGQAFGTTNNAVLYAIDLTNGQETFVGNLQIGTQYVGLNTAAFDMLTGELYGVTGDHSMVYVDTTTGKVTFIGNIGGDAAIYAYAMFMTYDWDAVSESNVESVNVYPNPAQGQFTVEGTGLMVITNVLGQEVLRQEVEEKATIELPAGMYIVRLNNAVSKVVVE